ncbi:hypothetical protein HK100_003490, partial [Physocladia obscura]
MKAVDSTDQAKLANADDANTDVLKIMHESNAAGILLQSGVSVHESQETAAAIQTREPAAAELGAMEEDVGAAEAKIAVEDVNNAANTDGVDGGFDAWMVVVASFVVHFLSLGNLYCFGEYATRYEAEGVGSAAAVQSVGSLGTAGLVGFGFAAGLLAERVGLRVAILSGAALMAGGLLLASFATRVWQLLLTQGLLFGAGCAFVYFPSLASLAQWWSRRRGVATGLAASGAGLGGLVLAPVLNALLSLPSVGTAWTLRAVALLIAVAIPATLPFVKQRVPSAKSAVPWSQLRNTRFLLLLGAVFFATAPNFIPAFFLPSYASDVVNLDSTDGAALVSIFNAASFFGRIAVGYAADVFIGKANAFLLCTLITSLSILIIWSLAHSFGALIIFAAICGFFSGAYFVVIPVIVGEMFGFEKVASLTGLTLTFSAIGYLGGPPLAGAIRDSSGYIAVCIFAGTLTFISALFCLAVRLSISKSLWKA